MADLPLLNAPATEIQGTVERVIFHNAENGFTVLKVQPDGKGSNGRALDAEVMVGHMTEPKICAYLRFRGQYTTSKRWGRQFAFDMADQVIPATEDGIRLYLASGLIKGVGEEIAGRIVAAFGLDTIRVLDEEPTRLRDVRGIGKKNYDRIVSSWHKHRGIRELLLFLQPHGISAAYAVRIYKAYGDEAMQVVRENPYRLAMDISGIGFMTADSIAAKLGFPPDHPLRIQAATLYMLQRASEDGHVFLPKKDLINKVRKLVDVADGRIETAIAELESAQRLVEDDVEEDTGVYLRRFHHCEAKTAYYLRRLLQSPKSVCFPDAQKNIDNVLGALPITLAPEQIRAVNEAVANKALIITGGPGTGKTTIINAIIRIYESVGARILLAAPTGRAARRMSETSGREAKTIHRLLEYSPKEDQFARNEDYPLACGLLVVDEASMMDTQLFYYLLKAVPLGATLLLVGDANQLPSVGPGNVLGDIILSRAVPVVELNEIFRQSAESEIICNAHLINRGQMPLLERSATKLSDFYFIARDEPEAAADLIVDLIKNHIPRRFGLDAVNDVQLLTPMHKGAVGAENMNLRLQEALNPNAQEVRRGERVFRLHDKVMQVRNNYDKDIFNGDIGKITHIDSSERRFYVDFDGTTMPYEFDELDELVPAYAISIHKSQGSEYPAVVIPVMMQHYVLLQRNLLYTGVTRGKKLVVLVGELRALQIAIRNAETGRRYTRLAQRLAMSNL